VSKRPSFDPERLEGAAPRPGPVVPQIVSSPPPQEARSLIDIRVIGVGGCGGNVINRMIRAGVQNVEYAAINTDAQALEQCLARQKLSVGDRITRMRGTGGQPELGRRAAEESQAEIARLVHGADMVFITAGMGGGTGTSAAPVVAQEAKRAGALTVAVVTMPFLFEGRPRHRNALAGIEALRQHVDALILIQNDKLLTAVPAGAPMTEAFALADEMLVHGVQSITELVTETGLVNVDFADVRSIMQNAGTAMMGVGVASGENRMIRAVEEAMANPLSDTPVQGAKGVLINFRGGEDMTIQEISAAAGMVASTVDQEANIIFGAVVDPASEEEVRVTLIATGFAPDRRQQRQGLRPLGEPDAKGAERSEPDDPDLPAFLRRRPR